MRNPSVTVGELLDFLGCGVCESVKAGGKGKVAPLRVFTGCLAKVNGELADQLRLHKAEQRAAEGLH